MMNYSVNDTVGKLAKRKSVCSSQDSNLPITSSDVLLLSFRRLVGARPLN